MEQGWLSSAGSFLPLLDRLPQDGLSTAVLALVLVIVLIPKLRTLVWDAVETVLASLLLVVLVAVVLGLPFGECFLKLLACQHAGTMSANICCSITLRAGCGAQQDDNTRLDFDRYYVTMDQDSL